MSQDYLLLCLSRQLCYCIVTELCCCCACSQKHVITVSQNCDAAASVYRTILLLYQCILLCYCSACQKNCYCGVCLVSTEYAVSVFSFFLVAECVWKKSFLVCRITQSALYRFWWTAANPQTGQLMVIISWDGSRLSKPAVWSACGL